MKLPVNIAEVKRHLRLKENLDVLGSMIDVGFDAQSNAVSITARGSSPAAAVALVQGMIDVYLQYRERMERARLEDHLKDAKAAVDIGTEKRDQARAKYDGFRREHGIADLSSEREQAISAAAGLLGEADRARAEEAAQQARLGQLRAAARSQSATALTERRSTAAVEQLSRVRGELAAAKAQYSDEHPKVQQLKAQIEELSSAIQSGQANEKIETPDLNYQALQNTLTGSAAEQRAASQRQASLKSLANTAQQRVAKLSALEGDASRLLAEVQGAETHLAQLQVLYVGAEDAARSPSTGFREAAPPVAPERALSSKARMPTSLGGGFIILLLGPILALVREFWKLRLRTPTEVAFWGKGPVIGSTIWPLDRSALYDLANELDDIVPDVSGQTLLVAATDADRNLAADVADQLKDWGPKTLVEIHGHEQRRPGSDPPRSSTARAESSAAMVRQAPQQFIRVIDRVDAPENSDDFDVWDGPSKGPALRRAARMADRVLVVIRSGTMSAFEVGDIVIRLGRQTGVGYLLVGLAHELSDLADRVGPVDDFWRARRPAPIRSSAMPGRRGRRPNAPYPAPAVVVQSRTSSEPPAPRSSSSSARASSAPAPFTPRASPPPAAPSPVSRAREPQGSHALHRTLLGVQSPEITPRVTGMPTIPVASPRDDDDGPRRVNPPSGAVGAEDDAEEQSDAPSVRSARSSPLRRRTLVGVQAPDFSRGPQSASQRRTTITAPADEVAAEQGEGAADAKKGFSAVLRHPATIAVVAGLVLGTGAAFLSRGRQTALPLVAEAAIDTQANTILHLSCGACADGTLLRVDDASAALGHGTAELKLVLPLPIGKSTIGVHVDSPEGVGDRDRVQEVEVWNPLRLKPDWGAINDEQPALRVAVEAVAGATVTLDGKPVALTDGHGMWSADLGADCTGTADDWKTIGKEIAFKVTVPGGAESQGVLKPEVRVLPLHLDTPSTRASLDGKDLWILVGRTAPGATVAIRGHSAAVAADGTFSEPISLPTTGAGADLRVRASLPGAAPGSRRYRCRARQALASQAPRRVPRARARGPARDRRAPSPRRKRAFSSLASRASSRPGIARPIAHMGQNANSDAAGGHANRALAAVSKAAFAVAPIEPPPARERREGGERARS